MVTDDSNNNIDHYINNMIMLLLNSTNVVIHHAECLTLGQLDCGSILELIQGNKKCVQWSQSRIVISFHSYRRFSHLAWSIDNSDICPRNQCVYNCDLYTHTRLRWSHRHSFLMKMMNMWICNKEMCSVRLLL